MSYPPTPSCSVVPVDLNMSTYSIVGKLYGYVKNNGYIKDNKVFDDHIEYTRIVIGMINYDSSYSKKSNTENTDIGGFNLTIPEFEANLPGFNIPRFPFINSGCKECISSVWLPTCDWETKSYKKCKKIFGKKFCISIPYYIPTKCENEIGFDTLRIPDINFFKFEKTSLIFNFEFVKDLEINFYSDIKKNQEVTTDLKLLKSSTFSFTIDKLILGMTIFIKKLEFSYGNDEFKLTNIKLPLFNIDFCSGGKILTSQITGGKLSLWYLLKNYSLSLYDVLISSGLIPENTSFFILNFLKETVIYINCGLLLCPQQPVPFFFVVQAKIGHQPFKGANKITIPNVPEIYLKMPKIPSNDLIPDSFKDEINKAMSSYNNFASYNANVTINIIKNYINNIVEAASINNIYKIMIPLIPPA